MLTRPSLVWLFCLLGWLVSTESAMNKKSWTYSLISIEAKSSNEDLMKWEAGIDRISRAVFALSGPIKINYDIANDDSYFEAHSYRSATGSSDYKLLPFVINKMPFIKFLNTFYKDLVMKSFAECSDLPRFENEFVPPFEKKVYTLNRCQISTDGLPQYLQEGYYKVILHGSGDVDWTVEALAKVEPKIS